MSNISPSIAIAIPTKDRPRDLETTVKSVLRQSVLSKQLIIIDQSGDEEGRGRVIALYHALLRDAGVGVRLTYVRDPLLSGLTQARNRALALVDAEIVLFLDDDVVLEQDFNERILEAYSEHPEAVGISGIITNPSRLPCAFRWWIYTFMRGPFWDDCQPVHLRAHQLRNSAPIRVARLSGCLMSFRVAAIRVARFDEHLHGACIGEDIDFCAQLWPGALYIAPKARLAHKRSPLGRSREGWLARHARTMWYLYRRHWTGRFLYRLAFLWLNCGYAVVAAVVTLRHCSRHPLQELVENCRRGFHIGNGYAQSESLEPQRVRY